MDNRYLLIGTSHVSKESQKKIKEAFNEFKPDIIAIELDRQRFNAMMSNQKSSLGFSALRQIGLTGYIFAVIGRLIQKKIGDVVGMNPGAEMLLGAKLAKNNQLPLALIDQDVSVTLKGLSKGVSFREKMRIVGDVIFAPFSKKNKVKIDLAKIPPSELIETLMEQMKERYSGFYKVLVDDRNRVMAKKIFKMLIEKSDKKILVIIGAGHEEGIKTYMKSLQASNVYK